MADVSFDRSFLVSSQVFTLDDSGGVFTARNGAVDHYDANGNALTGFTVASLFTAPNDIVRVGGKLYAVDGGSNKLHVFNTNGSGQQYSVNETDNKINIPRALAVSGNLVYVSTGETYSVARLSLFPTLGEFQLKFGWGVADNAFDSFQVCSLPNNFTCGLTGSTGTELGKVNDARGLAVDSGGNIYTAEQGNISPDPPYPHINPRVEVYNPDPAPVGAIGSQGSAAGKVNRPQGITLDGAGNLFVADQYNHRVDQFLLDGTFVRAFGFGVATGAATFETCTTTCQQGIAGQSPGQLSYPWEVAYDGAGHLYVSDGVFMGAPTRVSVFGAGGPGSGAPTPPGPAGGGNAGGGPPANGFAIGKLKGKTLEVDVLSAGLVKVVDAADKSVQATRKKKKKKPLGLKPSSATGGPGTIKVKLKLTSSAAKTLKRSGKVTVKAKITFTPNGGSAKSQTATLKLKNKKAKRKKR